jgi:hypothetical protein
MLAAGLARSAVLFSRTSILPHLFLLSPVDSSFFHFVSFRWEYWFAHYKDMCGTDKGDTLIERVGFTSDFGLLPHRLSKRRCQCGVYSFIHGSSSLSPPCGYFNPQLLFPLCMSFLRFARAVQEFPLLISINYDFLHGH